MDNIIGADGIEGKDSYALYLCEVCDCWYNKEDMVGVHLCVECETFVLEDLEDEL